MGAEREWEEEEEEKRRSHQIEARQEERRGNWTGARNQKPGLAEGGAEERGRCSAAPLQPHWDPSSSLFTETEMAVHCADSQSRSPSEKLLKHLVGEKRKRNNKKKQTNMHHSTVCSLRLWFHSAG